MNLNSTPSGERPHIAFFGCRNAGKSSLINAVTGQKLSIVSDVKGTTTDPVYKAMELLPAGPVMIIDTPGLDDEGELGNLRIEKALEVLRKTSLAILVIDGTVGITKQDENIFGKICEKKLPFIVVMNKCELLSETHLEGLKNAYDLVCKKFGIETETISKRLHFTSALSGKGIFELKEKIAGSINEKSEEKSILGDIVDKGDLVVLVVPIDKAAPKGRLILPQQQVIRDLLDHGAIPLEVRDTELALVIEEFGEKIKLVITDSQAFKKVSGIVPSHMPLTSFSILFSRYKGELKLQLKGVEAIKTLENNDKVLIAEGCTHHRQCGDIGRDKLPAIIRKICGCEPEFVFTSGTEYPGDLTRYKAVVHCGGCMLNEKEMKSRIEMTLDAGVPITNYGMVLAFASGVLERSMKVLSITHRSGGFE